jgi:hypothetical protein
VRGDPVSRGSSSPLPVAGTAVASAPARRRAARPRPAPTKLALFAAALAESTWLAAVLLTPVYFNIHSERIFEEDKAPLLRSLALCALLALAMHFAERGASRSSRRRPLWSPPTSWPRSPA